MKTIAIFDMDGTVLDSMHAWRSLNLRYADTLNVPLTDENRADIYQLSGSQFVRYFREQFGVETALEDVIDHAYEAMRTVYARGVEEKPGAKAYLQKLGERGVKRVLATATPTELTEIALQKSGLAPYFDLVLTTQLLGMEKSQPACWLEIARRAGGDAASCVVYEDAVYAMQGAHEAGMEIIGIEDETNNRVRDRMHALCTRVIADYAELD